MDSMILGLANAAWHLVFIDIGSDAGAPRRSATCKVENLFEIDLICRMIAIALRLSMSKLLLCHSL